MWTRLVGESPTLRAILLGVYATHSGSEGLLGVDSVGGAALAHVYP